jgi:iron complex transport system substrate-binding protein
MKISVLIFTAVCALPLCCAPLARAGRVVSLIPSYTEIIFELGAGSELAGVSSFCDRPPGVRGIEKVGDYLRPNLEKLYSLKPGIVFSGDWKGSSVAQDLRNAGIKVVELPEERRVEDIYRTIDLIAAELNRKKEAAVLIRKMKAGFKSGPAGPIRPSVYLEVDEGGWTSGKRSFLSDAIEKAGGRNIFAAEDKGFFQVSWEAVVKKDPAVVILLSGSASDFARRPLAFGLKAVKDGKVFTGLDRNSFSRPGPSLAGEIKKLRSWLLKLDNEAI